MANDPDMTCPASTAGPALEGLDSDAFARLLEAADAGQPAAWNRIYTLLYDDLHRIARSQIRRQAGPRLSPTSLISETWLKLSSARLNVASRRHLTSLIARAMRFLLLDETRRALTDTHSEAGNTPLHDQLPDHHTQTRLEQLLSLDQALNGLASIDRRLTRVVELRYFGGLSEREVADVLGVTERTVSRDWRRARAYLLNQLGQGENGVWI